MLRVLCYSAYTPTTFLTTCYYNYYKEMRGEGVIKRRRSRVVGEEEGEAEEEIEEEEVEEEEKKKEVMAELWRKRKVRGKEEGVSLLKKVELRGVEMKGIELRRVELRR